MLTPTQSHPLSNASCTSNLNPMAKKTSITAVRSVASSEKLATVMPDRIGLFSMLKDDICSLIPCSETNFIKIKKDGLCLFRCQLVTRNQDIAYASDVNDEELKRLTFEQYGELIAFAVERAFSISSLMGFYSKDETLLELLTEDLISHFKQNLHILWDPKSVLNLLDTYFEKTNASHCLPLIKCHPKDQKETAKIFSEAFSQTLLSHFRNPHIVVCGNHFLLKSSALPSSND